MNDAALIVTLSLIIIFSPFFAKRYKLPTTPVEIILGALCGYIGLLHHNNYFELVAEVGFLYLMFIAGTEVNLKKVLKTEASLMKRILAYLALLYFFSIGFALYFGLGKMFMVLLPLISVGLIATLSREYGRTPWLELSMTVGGIGEIVSRPAKPAPCFRMKNLRTPDDQMQRYGGIQISQETVRRFGRMLTVHVED